MDLRLKLENVDRLLTTSFATTARRKYNVLFESGNVSSFQGKLNELLISVSNCTIDMQVGFDFNVNDVQIWIDDLEVVLEQYKQSNNIDSIPTYTKLRDIIKNLVPQLNDPSSIIKKTLEQILEPKSEKVEEVIVLKTPIEIALEYRLKEDYKRGKKQKK